jgi:threonine dehydrogenase-like Zn-dependent dehydrogenase
MRDLLEGLCCAASRVEVILMHSRGLFGKKGVQLETRSRDIPPPGEDHVLVKVYACGVCGTDINFVRDWSADPMPLGHEISGEVLEVGKNVATVKPGDRVIVEDCTLCGVCDDCKSGQPQFCRNLFNLEGQPGMGEYLSVRSNCLMKYEGLDHVAACLTEPLAVSLTAVLNAQIPLGGSVAVLGPGPLGLMAARVAKLRGAGRVIITGLPADNPREQARRDVAARFGCDEFFEAGSQELEAQVKRRFPAGVDRVIVSSPPESLHDALKIVRFGGIVTFFGLDFGGRSTIQIDVNDLVFRKISLIPTFAEPAINFPVSNRLLREGLVDASALVTHSFGFDQACEVLRAVVDGTQPIVKAVMLPHGL